MRLESLTGHFHVAELTAQQTISLFWIAKDASTTTSTFYDIEKGWFSIKPLMFF